ncbi:LysR substrate-binding domain-containing protein [Yinghuangia aomiensis]
MVINDGILSAVGRRLLARAPVEAPHVTLRFLPEHSDDTPVLRDGAADLVVGSVRDIEPEARFETLLTERMVGVVRPGHLLADGVVTPERFAAADHVIASRRGRVAGPVDDALAALGLRRRIVATVPSYGSSLCLLLDSDAVGVAAETMSAGLIRALGLHTFPLPFDLPALTLGQTWHPRYDADGGHAWLRSLVRAAVADTAREVRASAPGDSGG